MLSRRHVPLGQACVLLAHGRQKYGWLSAAAFSRWMAGTGFGGNPIGGRRKWREPKRPVRGLVDGIAEGT